MHRPIQILLPVIGHWRISAKFPADSRSSVVPLVHLDWLAKKFKILVPVIAIEGFSAEFSADTTSSAVPSVHLDLQRHQDSITGHHHWRLSAEFPADSKKYCGSLGAFRLISKEIKILAPVIAIERFSAEFPADTTSSAVPLMHLDSQRHHDSITCHRHWRLSAEFPADSKKYCGAWCI
jgi:hypothetical protein